MTPSNELVNKWLKVAEASEQPRFIAFATLAAEWGAQQEREACAKVCEALGNDASIDEMEYRAFREADEAIRARGEGKP